MSLGSGCPANQFSRCHKTSSFATTDQCTLSPSRTCTSLSLGQGMLATSCKTHTVDGLARQKHSDEASEREAFEKKLVEQDSFVPKQKDTEPHGCTESQKKKKTQALLNRVGGFHRPPPPKKKTGTRKDGQSLVNRGQTECLHFDRCDVT